MVNFFKVKTNKQTLGQQITVQVERLDFNACGVARYQNKPVFIAGALPSEHVSVKITEQKSKYLRAKLINVDNDNVHRIKAACGHYASCGGCDLQHLAFSQHIAFKQQKVIELFSRNDINTELPWQGAITGQAFHYRRKARIGVQYAKDGRATIGFRKKMTNQLTPIKKCPVLVEPLSAVFQPLAELVAKLNTAKSIGHIEVIAAQNVTLIVRQLRSLSAADKQLWQQGAAQHHWQIYMDNGEQLEALTATSDLTYSLPGDINIAFSPKDFIQINHQVNLDMIKQAGDWLALKSSDRVLDLFCGLGNFSLSMAKQVQQLVAVEGVLSMVERARDNAEANGLTNCTFYQADLNAPWLDQAWSQGRFDKVLLDPARAGAWQAVQQIVQLKIASVLYISCDPATLARDSQCLVAAGYKMEKIAVMDMFSQTKHIETMVLFQYQS
jgi:23S rRNA (uracil1939-C5)-methyltransferase